MNDLCVMWTGAAGGQKEETATSSHQSVGLGLLAGHYDDDDDDEDTGSKAKDVPAAGLPADFFDSGVSSAPPAVSHSGSVSKPDDEEESAAEKKDKTAEALPEGFFDDPVRDAKGLPSLLSLQCVCDISSAASSPVTVANVKVDSIKYVCEY
ncbi:hypothetical protein QQF64_026082 [Cirrhinus molitorella]|uniref:Uncharacterized protein n=1 Tax=Cirrhinus molitorella TaxID=172907 RepID=A0ABR3NR56_9TELE